MEIAIGKKARANWRQALEPGEHFSYTSYHMIRSSRAIAQGSYLGITANGEPVVVGIPSFELVVPGTGEVGYC